MFRIHLRPEAPTTYREAYQDAKQKVVINKLLDYLFYEEKIMMINTLACMFSTVTGQKEVDRLAEGMLNAFKALKPEIEKLHLKQKS